MPVTAALFGLLWTGPAMGKEPCAATGAVYVSECCGAPLAECLKTKPDCEIAIRLDAFREWLMEKERPCSLAAWDLEMRHLTLTDTMRYDIDTSGMEWAGPADAPVTVVMYVSMSCPLCKRLYAELHDSLAAGEPGLRKAFKLGIKIFGTTRVDRALAAMREHGSQGLLLRALAELNKRIMEPEMEKAAAEQKVKAKKLWNTADGLRVQERVAADRAEGLRNGVDITPTIFINGRKYQSKKEARWIIDTVRYEVSRTKEGPE